MRPKKPGGEASDRNSLLSGAEKRDLIQRIQQGKPLPEKIPLHSEEGVSFKPTDRGLSLIMRLFSIGCLTRKELYAHARRKVTYDFSAYPDSSRLNQYASLARDESRLLAALLSAPVLELLRCLISCAT